MSRVELLFGEQASRKPPSANPPQGPDATRPLRMQVIGRSPQQTRVLRWRISVWARALRSAQIWGRAAIFGLIASAVQIGSRMELGQTILISAALTAIAVLSGAWTQVSIVTSANQKLNN